MIPGEVFTSGADIELNVGRETLKIRVAISTLPKPTML